jgi:broad specificity phosphatase PhoE
MSELHDIQPEDLNAIANHMATLHPDVIHKGLGHLISNKILQPHEAVTALEKIGKAREALSKPAEAKEVKPEAATPKPPEQPKEEKQETTSQQPDNSVIPLKEFRTLDYGDLRGTPESEEAKKSVTDAINAGDVKIGNTGDSFNEFKERVIPPLKGLMQDKGGNDVLSTHSSVTKLASAWDDMGRPDLDKMTPEDHKKMADLFNEEKITNGDVFNFKKDNGNMLYISRHGQTEDNKKGFFRTNDDKLTDKGIDQAKEAGEYVKKEVGGEGVDKIMSSDLPRSIHSAELMKSAIEPNPNLSPEGKVQINGNKQPKEASDALQGSYDRLIKGGDEPDDPDMKRLEKRINDLKSNKITDEKQENS